MIDRLIYLVLAIVVTLLVHLTSILAMPWLAERDAITRLGALARDNEMTLIPTAATVSLPYWDPSSSAAICRYALDRGPVRVRVTTSGLSIAALFMRPGIGVFQSYSDRAATQGILEMVVATPEQMSAITAFDADDEPVQEIRVISTGESGLVLVRAVVPVASRRAEIEAIVGASTCESESLDR